MRWIINTMKATFGVGGATKPKTARLAPTSPQSAWKDDDENDTAAHEQMAKESEVSRVLDFNEAIADLAGELAKDNDVPLTSDEEERVWEVQEPGDEDVLTDCPRSVSPGQLDSIRKDALGIRRSSLSIAANLPTSPPRSMPTLSLGAVKKTEEGEEEQFPMATRCGDDPLPAAAQSAMGDPLSPPKAPSGHTSTADVELFTRFKSPNSPAAAGRSQAPGDDTVTVVENFDSSPTNRGAVNSAPNAAPVDSLESLPGRRLTPLPLAPISNNLDAARCKKRGKRREKNEAGKPKPKVGSVLGSLIDAKGAKTAKPLPDVIKKTKTPTGAGDDSCSGGTRDAGEGAVQSPAASSLQGNTEAQAETPRGDSECAGDAYKAPPVMWEFEEDDIWDGPTEWLK